MTINLFSFACSPLSAAKDVLYELMSQPNSKKCEFLALSAFSLLVILIIYATILKRLYIMGYDEAGYAFLSAKIAIDILTSDT